MFTNLVFAAKRHVLLCSKPLDLPKFRLTPMLLSYPKSYVSKRTLSSARLISKRFSLVSLLFASWIFVPAERKKELALMLLFSVTKSLSSVECTMFRIGEKGPFGKRGIFYCACLEWMSGNCRYFSVGTSFPFTNTRHKWRISRFD